MFTTTRSSVNRDATGPVAGGARAWAGITLLSFFVRNWVATETGSDEAGEMAADATTQAAGFFGDILFGFLAGAATAARKKAQDAFAG